jgi:hypothetical protein
MVVAIALAVANVDFSRASQPLLGIIILSVVLAPAAGIALIALAGRTLKNRATRIVALVAVPVPVAFCC